MIKRMQVLSIKYILMFLAYVFIQLSVTSIHVRLLVGWLVWSMWSVGLSVIIYQKDGKIHFHAPFG